MYVWLEQYIYYMMKLVVWRGGSNGKIMQTYAYCGLCWCGLGLRHSQSITTSVIGRTKQAAALRMELNGLLFVLQAVANACFSSISCDICQCFCFLNQAFKQWNLMRY